MTLLIKNKDLIRRIKQTASQFDFNKLTGEETDALASVFYRFKDLFLAFRTHEKRFYDTVKKEIVLTTPIDYKWSEIYKGQYSHKDTDRDAINDSNQARMYNELLNQYARAYEYIATLE